MRFSYISFFIFCSCVLSAEKLKVFVSIPPQKYVVEQIGGDLVEVTSLLGEGDNPHNFSASPGVIKKLSSAALYFQVELPFEKVIVEKIKDYKLALEFKSHDLGVKKLSSAGHHKCSSDCAHETEEGVDRHFWVSALNAVVMAENTVQALSEKRPELKKQFLTNFNRFKKRFLAFHELNSKVLQHYAGRAFYVYHPAFGYFADEFGLQQKAVEVEGKKPSPRQLIKLIREAKSAGVKTVVTQNQFDQRAAAKVAAAIDGNVVEVNPLQEDLYQTLTKLTEAVKEGFKK